MTPYVLRDLQLSLALDALYSRPLDLERIPRKKVRDYPERPKTLYIKFVLHFLMYRD
jgi:hypothetical protein